MTKRTRGLDEAGTGAVSAGSGQVTRPTGPVTPARGGTVVHRVVPAQVACRIGARARAGERDAWPAVAAFALGSFALVAGGVIYDSKGPGGALVLAAAVAAAGSLALLGRAGPAISSPPAGSADLAREPGWEALTPSPGAAGGAGDSAG